VTLHNTRHLQDVDAAERDGAVGALSGVARVLVHTLADLNGLKSHGLVHNVTLFPHGAPPRSVAPPSRSLTRDDAVLIGCYGFFLPGKGIGELIAALGMLRARWPAARLRLVNAEYDAPESTGEIAICRQLAARLGLEGCIEWVTEFLPHDRSASLLAECDLVVLPYQASKEASSAALRNALGAGVPVAVTPLQLFEEAAAATIGLSGTDSPAISADLDRLLLDRERRESAQAAARDWLAERAWSGAARRLNGLLSGLRASAELQPPT
jgi:glycosyltransferase involved in cell wall biosynthesis